MKKLIYILLLLPFLFSCNQKKVKHLETQNDSLVQQAYAKDMALNEFLRAMNEIQYNLDSIKTKEMIINESTEGNVELRKSAKDQIKDDINTIYNLLDENKEKLADLRKQLGKANYQVKELEKMLANMTKQLEQKDKEIENLTAMLAEMDIKIIALSRDVDRLNAEGKTKTNTILEQREEIAGKTDELNIAHYIIGSKKELKEANIITSEGGFIGIGKNKKLKSDFDESFFTQIDIREMTSLAIPGKKVEIVTSHPSGSYEISGEGADRVLAINNYEEFWKTSRYLVVIVQ